MARLSATAIALMAEEDQEVAREAASDMMERLYEEDMYRPIAEDWAERTGINVRWAI